MAEGKTKKSGKKVFNILNGNFLLKEKFNKQFPFIVLVTVLLMILIGNTYIAEERTREMAKTTKELNDLHVEYIQLKSSIMQATKQSVLSAKLKEYGIKESIEPISRINTKDIAREAGLPDVSEEPNFNSADSIEANGSQSSLMGKEMISDTIGIKNIN